MRRIFLGLLIALLTFGAGALFVKDDTRKKVVNSSGSMSWTFPDDKRMTRGYHIFSDPSEATDDLNTQLQQAADYIEFTPCFDKNGQRIGERAVRLFFPPRVPQATWRIVWTQQSEDSSESFWVESAALSDARHFETKMNELKELEIWKKCDATK